MIQLDPKHKKCFKRAKEFVRDHLQVDRFVITNHKIIRFCHELDNDLDRVKHALKKHAGKMKQIDLRRIQKLPRKFCQPCKCFSVAASVS